MRNVFLTLSKYAAALLLLMMSAAIVSCSDDNPVTDQPDPEPGPDVNPPGTGCESTDRNAHKFHGL